jgi:hypothetical protein
MSDSKKVVLMIIGGVAVWAGGTRLVYSVVKAILPDASTGTAGIITSVVIFLPFIVWIGYELYRAPEIE